MGISSQTLKGTAGAHLGEGSSGSGPLPFFQADQTVSSILTGKSQ